MAVLLVFMSGCRSLPGDQGEGETPDPYASENPRQEVDRLLGEGAPVEAFLVWQKNEESWDGKDYSSWKEKIADSMGAEFRRAVEAEEWERAAVLGQTRWAVTGKAPQPMGTEEALLRSVWKDPEVPRAVQQAVWQGIQDPSGIEIGLRREAEAEYEPGYPVKEPKDLLPGVVTIWVDKGLKLQSGVGYPDRVIGSGFFIDPGGYLITNYHVIASEVDPEYEGYSRLFIKKPRAGNERVPARVVGYDKEFDLALLKTEAEPGYIFPPPGKEPVEPGEEILALGSPGGLESTATAGIVSAVEREFLPLGEVFQIDVPVNPGNSGGPLLTRDGRLCGVVFAGIAQFDGVNFAIPSSYLTLLLPRLFTGGEVDHSWIGAAVHEGSSGLEVIYIFPGSPADRMGLRRGDRLTRINGKQLDRRADFQRELLHWMPNTGVRLSWEREGRSREGVAVTAARPDSPLEEALKKDSRNQVFLPLYGMETERIGKTLWDEEFRVVNLYSGMPADEAGLSRNDSFRLQKFSVLPDQRAAVMRLIVKQRTAGYLENLLQIASYLDKNIFL